MKKIKMKRNREQGSEVLRGEHSYVLADSVADALIADGHAVLVEVVPEAKKAKSEPPKTEPEPEHEAGEKEESVTRRKKK